MSIIDYDRIVSYIEDNIRLEHSEIKKEINRMLVLSDRRADEYFQNIDPQGRTANKYIRDRKYFCALAEFIEGKTAATVVEEFGLGDPTSFNVGIKTRTKKSPKVLRSEGFQCPRPMYLKDIVGESFVYTKGDDSEVDKDMYIEEIKRLIDENEGLKNEVSNLMIRDIEHGRDKESYGSRHSELITTPLYEKFLEIENCRVSFGFEVKDIVKLYEESVESGVALKELCERALYSFRFEQEIMDTSDYEIERLGYHLEYEMDSEEAFNYYFNDDGIDAESDPYTVEYNLRAEYDISDVEFEEYRDNEWNIEDDEDFDVPEFDDLGIEDDHNGVEE